jgi:hypothetical protein
VLQLHSLCQTSWHKSGSLGRMRCHWGIGTGNLVPVCESIHWIYSCAVCVTISLYIFIRSNTLNFWWLPGSFQMGLTILRGLKTVLNNYFLLFSWLSVSKSTEVNKSSISYLSKQGCEKNNESIYPKASLLISVKLFVGGICYVFLFIMVWIAFDLL